MRLQRVERNKEGLIRLPHFLAVELMEASETLVTDSSQAANQLLKQMLVPRENRKDIKYVAFIRSDMSGAYFKYIREFVPE